MASHGRWPYHYSMYAGDEARVKLHCYADPPTASLVWLWESKSARSKRILYPQMHEPQNAHTSPSHTHASLLFTRQTLMSLPDAIIIQS